MYYELFVQNNDSSQEKMLQNSAHPRRPEPNLKIKVSILKFEDYIKSKIRDILLHNEGYVNTNQTYV